MQTLFVVAVYVPLIPALLAVFYWNRLNGVHRWFAVLLWIVSLLSIAGFLWAEIGQQNNLPFFHSYILIEFLFLMLVFSKLLEINKGNKWWWLVASVFVFAWVFNIIFGEGWFGYPAYIHTLEAIFAIGFSLLYFAKLLREKIVLHPARTFGFWLCTGIIIYFSGNLLLFIFSNFVVEQSNAVFIAIWGMHALLVILLYLIYSVAIIWAKKNPTSF